MRLEEIESLKQRLEKERIFLRERIELKHRHKEIVGRINAIHEVYRQMEQAVPADTTVLIEGRAAGRLTRFRSGRCP